MKLKISYLITLTHLSRISLNEVSLADCADDADFFVFDIRTEGHKGLHTDLTNLTEELKKLKLYLREIFF